ncbi:DUF6049 family protein [Microbacterium sp.]|uniref:DUF6049 family protein n=1 Tax=Microbacterium sp. TaxID=51671 RepID=UPI00261327C9|nr:DUF6049 family protein [Microbacterium sp.]
MISPHTGIRARAQRGARGFVVFTLAAALIAAAHLSGIAPASADVDEADEETVELSVTAGVHGVIQPDTSLTTTVTIANTTGQALSGGHVTLELNDTALTASDQLSEWLDSGVAPGTFAPLAAEDSEAVPASESATTTVFTAGDTISDLPSGVYPIRAKLSGATTGDGDAATTHNVTENSVLVVDSDTTAQITALVPITATPTSGALLTADELTALTGDDGALTAQLDGVAGTSAVLAVDPLIPAAIRALGSAAPPSAAEWLTRLESLANERFALQAGDADATVQTQAGLSELLKPLPLSSFLNEENFLDSPDDATASPSPSPTPTGPVLPTDDELMELRLATDAVVWPTGDVRSDDLTRFDALFDTKVTTILPSTSLAAHSSAHSEIGESRVLVAESAAGEALSDAAAEADDADLREDHIIEALAHLALASPQTSLLVGLDRDEGRTADALRSAVLSLATIGDPVGLTALRSTEPASATLAETSEQAITERTATLEALISDEARLTAFASILDDPLMLRSPERLQLLRVLSVGSADTYAEDAAEHRAATTETMNAVGVQEPSPIQLFTSAAPLPVWVRNDLPWPVNVRLSATPSDARLDVEPTIDVVAQPGSNTRVKVPVSSRVGSGTLSVNFSLNSPTGVQIGVDRSATVTVRAEWENIGLGILGGLIVLLLALGIVRTVIRRRKDRRVENADEADAAASDDTKDQVTGE